MLSSRSTTSPPPGRLANGLLWVLQILLALAFVVPVYRKFAGVPESVELFETIGLGQWLRYAVGLLELILAVGLVVPRFAKWAAAGIVGVMAGAAITEGVVAHGNWLFPLVLLAAAAVIGWARR